MAYDVKVVHCGNVLEIYKYSTPIQEGFKKIERPKVPREKTQREIDENLHRSIKRSKRKIFELVNSNYVKNKSSFLTLTFKDNMTDYDVAFDCWDRFKKKIEYHFDFKLQYCGVVEFQTKNYKSTGRCAIHFHICLFNVPYLKQNVLYDLWNMTVSNGGGVNIKKIEHVDNVGAYITSYMTEDIKERDIIFDDKFKGKKRYFASRGLKTATISKFDTNDKNQENIVNTLLDYHKDNVVFEYSSKYEKTKEFVDIIEFSNGKKKLVQNVETIFSQELDYKQIILNKNKEFRNSINNDIKIIL